MTTRRNKGFTRINLLVVIVFIVIVAAIIMHRLFGEARENTLKAYLQEMRDAIGYFHADCGDYPAKLNDIMATQPPDVGGNDKKIKASDFKGPYFMTPDGELPRNPINDSNEVVREGVGRAEHFGWTYNPKTGRVRAAAGTAIDGSDYSKW